MLLSFLKDGMSSLVGPRISTLGGRGGWEPCKKGLGASLGGCSRVSSCRPASVGTDGGGVLVSATSVASGIFGGRGADGDSVTVAGLFSHLISEDCGISRCHHVAWWLVGGWSMELTLCGDSTTPNFEDRRSTEVFEIQRASRSCKAYTTSCNG